MKIAIIEKYTGFEINEKNGDQSESRVIDVHSRHKKNKKRLEDKFDELGYEQEWLRVGSLFDENKYSLVTSFGGDGTTLYVAGNLVETPLFSINSEKESSVGALTNFSSEDFEDLRSYIEQGNIRFFPRLRALVNGTEIMDNALNEILISSVSKYDCSDLKIGSQNTKSSGLLVATSLGSTAWYKSAGGRPFKDGFRYILRDQNRPDFRLNGEVDSRFIVETLRNNCDLAYDSNGSKVTKLSKGDKITFAYGDPLKMIIK
jgi:NAD kinase